jgi:lysophosphatidylcholine acyltransferase/lyso-PAF acetyltransferase
MTYGVSQGTTTNGKYLLPFKTGAFIAGVPVKPIVLKYKTVR